MGFYFCNARGVIKLSTILYGLGDTGKPHSLHPSRAIPVIYSPTVPAKDTRDRENYGFRKKHWASSLDDVMFKCSLSDSEACRTSLPRRQLGQVGWCTYLVRDQANQGMFRCFGWQEWGGGQKRAAGSCRECGNFEPGSAASHGTKSV